MIGDKTTCSICSKEFPRDGKRRICSVECYAVRKKAYNLKHKVIPKKRECLMCKNIIEIVKNKKYCSPACIYLADMLHMQKHNEVMKECSKLRSQSKPHLKRIAPNIGRKNTKDTKSKKDKSGPVYIQIDLASKFPAISTLQESPQES